MSIAYIGLGSNLHQPVQQLRQARAALSRLQQCRLLGDSGLFKSKAMTLPQSSNQQVTETQPDYINAVVKLETQLDPLALLDQLQAIEQQQGRVRETRWGPRTLDLDILLYDDLQMNEPRLTIPHVGLAQRDFVLYPLQAIDKTLEIPGLGALDSLLTKVSKQHLTYLGTFE